MPYLGTTRSVKKSPAAVEVKNHSPQLRAISWPSKHFSSLVTLESEDCIRANEVLAPLAQKTGDHKKTLPTKTQVEVGIRALKKNIAPFIHWVADAKIEFSQNTQSLISFSRGPDRSHQITLHEDLLKLPRAKFIAAVTVLLLYGCTSAQLDSPSAGQRAISGFMSTALLGFIASETPRAFFPLAGAGFFELSQLGWDTKKLGLATAGIPNIIKLRQRQYESFGSGKHHEEEGDLWDEIKHGAKILLSKSPSRTVTKDKLLKIGDITDAHRAAVTTAFLSSGLLEPGSDSVTGRAATHLDEIRRSLEVSLRKSCIPKPERTNYIKDITTYLDTSVGHVGFDDELARKFSLTTTETEELALKSNILPTRAQTAHIAKFGSAGKLMQRDTLGWLISTERFFEAPRVTPFLDVVTLSTNPTEFNLIGEKGGTPSYYILKAMSGCQMLTALIGRAAITEITKDLTQAEVVKLMGRFSTLYAPKPEVEPQISNRTAFLKIFTDNNDVTLTEALQNRPQVMRVLNKLSEICEISESEERHDYSDETRKRLTWVPPRFVQRFGYIIYTGSDSDIATTRQLSQIHSRSVLPEIYWTMTGKDVLISLERASKTAQHLPQVRRAIVEGCIKSISPKGFNAYFPDATVETLGGQTTPRAPLRFGAATAKLFKEQIEIILHNNPLEALPALDALCSAGSLSDIKPFIRDIVHGVRTSPAAFGGVGCKVILKVASQNELFLALFDAVLKQEGAAHVDTFVSIAEQQKALVQELLQQENYALAKRILSTENSPVALKMLVKQTLSTEQFRAATKDMEPAVLAKSFGSAAEASEMLGAEDDRLRSVTIRKTYLDHRKSERCKLTITDFTTGEEDIQNHYAILGIPFDANEEEVKASYRLLSRAFHPDLVAEPAEKKLSAAMQSRINNAKEVLLVAEKRYAFDSMISENQFNRSREYFPQRCWFDSAGVQISGFERPSVRGGHIKSPPSATSTALSSPKLLGQ